jgi:hypothetical protein
MVERRSNIGETLENGVNCGNQVGLHSGFGHKSTSTLFEASVDVFLTAMDGKEYKLGCGARLHKLADRLNSAHDRHGDIDYNDVRTKTKNF